MLTDFKPDQFTLNENGDVYLVDGPAPNSGPVVDLVKERYASRRLRKMGVAWRNKTRYFEPGSTRVPCEVTRDCSQRTYSWHSACADAGRATCANSRGAPEIDACVRGGCKPFDGRVHVFDAAAKSWILPHISEVAEDRAAAAAISNILPRMLERDPEKRATFDDVVAALS